MSSNVSFVLRFPEVELQKWAARNLGDSSHMQTLGESARNRGHVSRAEFLAICAVKSPRTKPRCSSNATELIEEATRISFTSSNDEMRIRSLMILAGVSWPTASFILHFCHPGKYPILDFRALWSLSVDKPPIYTYHFWMQYVEFCRALAERHGMSMRDLDAALWQYSKEMQGESVQKAAA
jgi:hypothetical protein